VVDLSTLFPDQFSGNSGDWTKVLEKELKLTDVGHKLSKNTLEGIFNILSTEAHGQVIPNSSRWKKASQTYLTLTQDAELAVQADLDNGVRCFFLTKETESLKKLITRHVDAKDIEIVLLDNNSGMIDAREIVTGGGNHKQELAALTYKLIKWCESHPTENKISLMISVDNHFFQSIAKIRAMREIAEKVFTTLNLKIELRVISSVNTREWTLLDRYTNMLRNTSAVAAALVGGADIIQSLGYMTPFELETNNLDPEHMVRSRRMSRNTTHILSLESMLGMVEDAAAGSYHIETLTENYAKDSWELMQKILPLAADELNNFWSETLTKIQNERTAQFNHRKLVLSGINDFPNMNEKLEIKGEIKKVGFRLARGFELLRQRIENLKPSQKKNIRLIFWGDYAALNARVNFVKNYFQLLGLTVLDAEKSIQDLTELKSWTDKGNKEELIVLCAKDEEYPELIQNSALSKTGNYIAGKVEHTGFEAIYGGQDIYAVLSNLVSKLEALS